MRTFMCWVRDETKSPQVLGTVYQEAFINEYGPSQARVYETITVEKVWEL